jgi:hypothetical protein
VARTPQVHPAPPTAIGEDGLLVQLTREAAARPKGALTVEEVLTRFEKAGLAIARKQQVLALPVQAAYCVVAVTRLGLNMSICEFDTPEHAKAGLALSERTFRAVQHRTLAVNGRTMLTLIQGAPTPELRAQRDEAQKLFSATSR